MTCAIGADFEVYMGVTRAMFDTCRGIALFTFDKNF